jgi:ACS family hexuronate transporter-like MFS transporter
MNYRRLRWIIFGLLFLASTINYMDRQTLSVLGPTLRRELHLTERDYASAVAAFLVPYMIMYATSGRVIDRVGVRLGMAVCLGWWSIATMLTSLARSAFSLAATARQSQPLWEPSPSSSATSLLLPASAPTSPPPIFS